MPIECCKNCVPPERKIGCHATCEKYLAERSELDRANKIRQLNYDFDRAYIARVKKSAREKRINH